MKIRTELLCQSTIFITIAFTTKHKFMNYYSFTG